MQKMKYLFIFHFPIFPKVSRAPHLQRNSPTRGFDLSTLESFLLECIHNVSGFNNVLLREVLKLKSISLELISSVLYED